jgi:hypothetical protein
MAVSHSGHGECDEEIAADDPALAQFVASLQPEVANLRSTDQGFIRVLEDVVDLLIEKDLICLADLPQDAQDKILLRKQLRRRLRGGNN